MYYLYLKQVYVKKYVYILHDQNNLLIINNLRERVRFPVSSFIGDHFMKYAIISSNI